MNLGFVPLRKNAAQLRSDLRRAGLGGMFKLAGSLRQFFRARLTVQQAEEQIKQALEAREERFLNLALAEIYKRPNSPYLKLLKIAGCEFSDLRAEVRGQGLEETLKRLAGAGVYLTSEEFKGKREVVRGGRTFRVSPEDFERLDPYPGLAIQSSGTKNKPVVSIIHLDWLAARALSAGIFFSAHDLFARAHATYDAILPGTGFTDPLNFAKFGKASDRWFARKIPIESRLEGAYHYLITYLTVLMGRCFGPGFPRPEIIDVAELGRIVRWIEANRREGKNCVLTTIPSSAARIARVAEQMGVSLEGTKFSVGGEPLTEAKEDAIRRSGAGVTSRYAYGGGVSAGYGCANPLYRDEIHISQDMLALIDHPAPPDATPVRPLLCTTLHPAAPRLLLNVANGDYATFDSRICGCALEKVGFGLHLHSIRSYEKFTSEGMNYFYGDLFELFEKELPAEFGGCPGDYQLVEEEDSSGQTRLTLLVHPDVGELDAERLLPRLRAALAEGSRGNRFMTELWQEAGTFRILRKVPYASARGKILPLHTSRGST
jgi:hypothetical protein